MGPKTHAVKPSLPYTPPNHREVLDFPGEEKAMTHVCPETQRVLEACGWREDRHVDTANYERILRAAGYDDFQAACAFLQRFGDLSLQLDLGSEEAYLNTLLSEILPTLPPTPVSPFSEALGRTLYYIGSCVYAFYPLLMDSSGRVYRITGGAKPDVYGLDLMLIAASGEEAIAALVEEHQTGRNMAGEWIANGEWAALADGTIRSRSQVNPHYS